MKKIIASILASVILAGSFFYFEFIKPAIAGVSCSLPYTLTNGTTADATQVMANYTALVNCLLNAAAAGANNDITSLSALTTPITPTQGGSNVFIGTTPTVSGSELVITGTTPTGFSNTKGYTVVFAATASNSGATLMSVNGQAAVNLYKQSTAGPTPLTGSELQPNQIYLATYDGTEFQINPVPNVAAGWGLAQNASASALQINSTNPPYGFGPCVNLQLNASVASNLLTVSFVAADVATNASINHPILCSFRDTTIANGDPQWIAITSALSINTNATGATLGSLNSTPFRFWITAFDNSGTVVPALINASVPTPTAKVFPLDEASPQSTTAISNAATSAGVYYTPNGTTLSSKPFRILGYLEYASGLTTAGTYASGPTKIQLFGPGIKKPGDVIQTVTAADSTSVNSSGSTPTATNLTAAITPTSAVDLIFATASGSLNSTTGGVLNARLYRGSTVPFGSDPGTSTSTPNYAFPCTVIGLDGPGSASSTNYTVYIWGSSGNAGWNANTTVTFIVLNEIMG